MAIREICPINASVVSRLARKHDLGRSEAEQCFVEMLRFLDVAVAAGEPVSPPPLIDQAWHEFILHTRDYEAYCRDRFGFFVHHQPTENRIEGAYRAARQRAIEQFGSLDPRFWPETGAADCSDACQGP
jgi:hypothetical protein